MDLTTDDRRICQYCEITESYIITPERLERIAKATGIPYERAFASIQKLHSLRLVVAPMVSVSAIKRGFST